MVNAIDLMGMHDSRVRVNLRQQLGKMRKRLESGENLVRLTKEGNENNKPYYM
jgi:hypothetical protein